MAFSVRALTFTERSIYSHWNNGSRRRSSLLRHNAWVSEKMLSGTGLWVEARSWILTLRQCLDEKNTKLNIK